MFSSNNPTTESDFSVIARLIAAALLFWFIIRFIIPDSPGMFFCMLCWQFVHMYIIGRKDITLDNFDGVDLVAGIPVIFFLFQNPPAYLLSAGLVYLITGKRSNRAD